MANIVINKMPGTTNDIIISKENISGDGTLDIGTKTVTLYTKDTYVPENIDVIVKAQATIKKGALNNEATTGIKYNDESGSNTIIPAEGSLYINEGWYPNTKITLGHLIPDDAAYTNAGDGHILSGYEAYDTNGKELIGTIPTVTPTFSGGDISVTPSISNSDITKATATIESTGTFKTSTKYGVTPRMPDTAPNDGTTFLTIDGTLSTSDGSVKPTASATRAAFNYNQNSTGYINKASGTQAIAAQTTATTKTATTGTAIGVNATDDFGPLYIPIVSATFAGGSPSATAGGSVTTTPAVTYSASAEGKDSGGTKITDFSVYGISTGSTTNNGYIVISSSGSATTTGSVNATASATFTDITYSNNAGAIEAHSGTLAMSCVTPAQDNKPIEVKPTATAGSIIAYKIPIVSPAGTGGDVTKNSTGNSATASVKTNPVVTVSSSGTLVSEAASYAVTTTPPSGTDGTTYLTITSKGTPGDAQPISGKATISYTRASVTSKDTYKGAVSMTTSTSLLSSANGILEQSISGSVQAKSNGTPTYYVPVVSPYGVVSSHTITAPTVGSTLATDAVSGDATSVTAVTYDSDTLAKTAAGTNGKYVKIETDTSVIKGKSKAKAKGGISAGITSGSSGAGESGENTMEIGVTAGTKTVKYMAVYGGAYTVS